ncbi:amino acid adenylation domain-containing protein [Bacillus cereus]|uniref:amino acid adenylation domain-containing protein n=1 Tax=Bacillus cereus TaxID=1396 RepID=UPI00397EBE14
MMGLLVHELLTNNLHKNRDNILLKEKGSFITHGDLEKKSNKFCNYLEKMGVKKNDRVAIIADSSINAVIALMGIMKRGAIFVPINVNNALSNTNFILQETEASLLIIDERLQERVHDFKYIKENNIPIIINGKANVSHFHCFNDYMEYDSIITDKPKIISKDIVYIIFTSGTTGKPKGVMINHESICSFMTYVVDKFQHNADTRTLSKTPLSFDPYLTEIVPSFIGGGTVYLYKELVSIRNFLKVLQDEKITNFGCGPSLLLLLAENKTVLKEYDLSNLEQIYFGYENCPINTIATLQVELPDVSFINGYGTTETYASSTFHIVDKLEGTEPENIPLGEPIKGTELMILNSNLQLTKQGEVGELVIRGNTLMNGYWKNEEETNRVLRYNPLFPNSLEKVYFTGDYVRMDKNNNILFVGRKDEQVKIQGYRVELSEIQNCIETHNVVKECCVITVEEELNKRMVCYLRTANNSEEELLEVREFSIKALEAYKIPSEWLLIDEMPRNLNSKVDKRELKNIYYNNKITTS